jgi:hypothetical protein
MDLKNATGMILAESASHPELLRVSRHAYDELAAGREVGHRLLSGMLREAARKNVYPALIARHGRPAFDDMVTVIAREIDRQAPVVRH